MIDYDKELVSALNTVLPTYYELILHSGISTPCISYQEINNYIVNNGDTLGYSKIYYRIKVWGNDIQVLQEKSKEIDIVMHQLGFQRVSSGELFDNQSTMIQKILDYEALALEEYTGGI